MFYKNTWKWQRSRTLRQSHFRIHQIKIWRHISFTLQNVARRENLGLKSNSCIYNVPCLKTFLYWSKKANEKYSCCYVFPTLHFKVPDHFFGLFDFQTFTVRFLSQDDRSHPIHDVIWIDIHTFLSAIAFVWCFLYVCRKRKCLAPSNSFSLPGIPK